MRNPDGSPGRLCHPGDPDRTAGMQAEGIFQGGFARQFVWLYRHAGVFLLEHIVLQNATFYQHAAGLSNRRIDTFFLC